MELIDFNCYPVNDRFYGGISGQKVGIKYAGANYLIKYPSSLKQFGDKFELSYSNSPISEYLGSHIYSILDIPAQETLLGTRGNHIVVACKDFRDNNEMLYEFGKIKTTFDPDTNQLNNAPSSGNRVDLIECLEVIYKHPTFEGFRQAVLDRFWDMFVVDAYIANPDRNNGNWGLLINETTNEKRLTPVFDNGNALGSKWADTKMMEFLELPEKQRIAEAVRTPSVYKVNDERINPRKFMMQTEIPECLDAMKRVALKIKEKQNSINNFIDNMGLLSDVQKKFYKTSLEDRYQNIFLKALESRDIGNEHIK